MSLIVNNSPPQKPQFTNPTYSGNNPSNYNVANYNATSDSGFETPVFYHDVGPGGNNNGEYASAQHPRGSNEYNTPGYEFQQQQQRKSNEYNTPDYEGQAPKRTNKHNVADYEGPFPPSGKPRSGWEAAGRKNDDDDNDDDNNNNNKNKTSQQYLDVAGSRPSTQYFDVAPVADGAARQHEQQRLKQYMDVQPDSPLPSPSVLSTSKAAYLQILSQGESVVDSEAAYASASTLTMDFKKRPEWDSQFGFYAPPEQVRMSVMCCDVI